MLHRVVLSLSPLLFLPLLIAPALGQVCPGDCSGDGRVSAAELTRMVALILLCDGAPGGCTAVPSSCPAGDTNGNGRIDVADLVTVIQQILRFDRGCPPSSATPTPPPSPSPTLTVTPTATAFIAPTASATASPTATPTALLTATPTATASPTAQAAVCGNGVVEPGETCDDGNQVTNPPADTCPEDCRVDTCSPSGSRFTVAVQFAGANNIASIDTVILYPDGTVQIPGTGTDASVGVRITNRPSGFLVDWFDFDFSLRVALVGTRALAVGTLYQVSFDLCTNAAPPDASAFRCRVLEANNTNFQPVAGLTCTVVAVP